jgi:hypothetical protein
MRSLDLSDILSPVTVAEFFAESFGVSPLHVAGTHVAGTPGRFASLLPWADVNDILGDPGLSSRVQFTGEPDSSAAATQPGEGNRASGEGSAFVIERMDEVCAPVAVLAQCLERTLEAPLRVSLYAGLSGLALHRDEHDVLILQIAGQNQWRAHGNAEQEPSEQPTSEALLQEGDALYIPRGWWHANTPRDRETLQLTFGIENPTGIGLLTWLAEFLKEQECFRTEIPRFADPATRSAYATTIRRTIMRACRAPGLLESYARHLNETAPPRPVAGVPWSPTLSGEYLIAWATPRQVKVRRADPKTIYFTVNHKRFAFPEDAAPLIHYLNDNAPVSISKFYADLDGEFDRDELSDFVSVLTRDGILALQEPGATY